MNDEPAVDSTAAPSPPPERALLASFRLRREPRGEPAEAKTSRPGFDLRYERDAARLQIVFQGRIDRKVVLSVHDRLMETRAPVRQIQLDVSAARGLKLPALAPLAMLGGELERLGYEVAITGIPPELRREAIGANLHHLLNFE